MKDKYTIETDVYETYREHIEGTLHRRLSEEGLQELVDVRFSTFKSGDYGINPIADKDSRSFFSLTAPDGEQLLPPPSDIHPRTSFGETDNWINVAIRKIREHQTKEGVVML